MGWMMNEDREVFDKKVAASGLMPEPVAICGAVLPKGTNPFQAPNVAKDHASLTRHHVIPHHLLIAVWNKAVERGDFDLIKALAIWAGRDPTAELPATLDAMDPNPNPDPQQVLMRVAWNPWNIVIGPKMEHRIGDPTDAFDRLQFRDLPAFDRTAGPIETNEAWKENLARQEFNLHVDRLYRIYKYMVRYVDPRLPLADVEVMSLITLLRSDHPSKYGRLNDGRKSLIRFGGAILSPALWTQFSFRTIETHGLPVEPKELRDYRAEFNRIDQNKRMPQNVKEKQLKALPAKHFGSLSKSTKILENTTNKWGVVAWSAVSYLPEPDLPEPKIQIMDLWEPGQATLPNPRYLLSRATWSDALAKDFRAEVIRAARRTGRFKGHVKIVGPRGPAGAMHPRHDDVVKATLEALTTLRADGYDFRIGRTFLEAPALEVRFYSELTP
ncbi:MAG TPA: hypothetical protein VIL32_16590 [Steroidobacteraceae bacterium]